MLTRDARARDLLIEKINIFPVRRNKKYENTIN